MRFSQERNRWLRTLNLKLAKIKCMLTLVYGEVLSALELMQGSFCEKRLELTPKMNSSVHFVHSF